MAFNDPQSATVVGTTATSLPRVGSGDGTGAFRSSDGSVVLDVRHSYGRVIRSTAGISLSKYAQNPADSSRNIPVAAKVRVVIEKPSQGFTPAELETLLMGLINNLTASTNANLKKLIGGEA